MAGKNNRALLLRMKSFQHAFAGWWYVLKTQKNSWIHAAASIMVFLLGLWLGLSRVDWAILLLTITLVWVAEFINTALEALVDLTMPEIHPLAKAAKDVSAAAVLLCACASIGIGLLILGPPLWQQLTG